MTKSTTDVATAAPRPRLRLLSLLAERRWTPVTGYVVYIGVLAAGYYYNLTFVQLGIIDLGTVRLGLDAGLVSGAMAVLALLALATSVGAGVVMDRVGWSRDLRAKVPLLAVVAAVQLSLTVVAPLLGGAVGFVTWVALCGITIGVGIPVTFSLMGDLIPVRDRGFAAACAAAAAFFVAALYPQQWRIEEFSAVMGAVMLPAVLALTVLAWRPPRVLDELAAQRRHIGPGRYCRSPHAPVSATTFSLVVGAMFAVFFIDSLGFLRIIDAPAYIATSWQSTDQGVRMTIAVAHVVGAAMAGVMYTAFDWRWLLLWVFGLFAFTHLLYTFHMQTAAGTPPLALPLTYVLAVSFYTTLNFALWPDLSTGRSIGARCGIGVGVAGWLASFLSTALALRSDAAGIPLVTHLRWVNALALLLVLAVAAVWYGGRVAAAARRRPL